MRSALFGAVLAIACRSAFAAGQPGAGGVVPLARLSERPYAFTTFSGVPESTHFVVRDSVHWMQTWTTIHRPFIPAPAPPHIDFQREMIVVAALGNRPSEGYDVLLERAVEDSTGIEVDVRVSAPASGCPVGAATTQPVDLARIPASGRPVRFRERNIVVPCGVR
jgi:hypothetical protein